MPHRSVQTYKLLLVTPPPPPPPPFIFEIEPCNYEVIVVVQYFRAKKFMCTPCIVVCCVGELQLIHIFVYSTLQSL